MKKLMGIALVLAVAVMLMPTAVFAADPPEVTVNFNATDPDITVTSYKPNTGDWAWEGTAQFTLSGTGSASGTVTGDFDGVFECYTDYTGQPQVYGGYTASGGDFKSTFSAYSYETDSGYFEMAAWSDHSIDATGVTAGSMTVNGAAIAAYGSGSHFGGFVEGWQTYTGEAEEVEVFASKLHSNRQPVGGTWDDSKITGAEFTATGTGSSTATFVGKTEAGTYPNGTETSPYQVLAKQGVGFDIDMGSSVDGTLNTTYPYTNVVAFDKDANSIGTQITYNSGWAIIEAFNADRIVGETASWNGLPGYTVPLP